MNEIECSHATIYPKQQIGGQNMEYGYVRVSTREQNERRQFAAL